MGTIETEEHRRVLAAERLSAELADRNEDMPEPGDARRAAVEEWLNEHPEVVVGAAMGRTYFAVGDIAAHEGFVTSRAADDEWAYQELTGGGSVLYEGPSADEAQRVLDEWLRWVVGFVPQKWGQSRTTLA